MSIENWQLNAKQAAIYLKIDKSTLRKWRAKGVGPRYKKCNGEKYYDFIYEKKDLDSFIEEQNQKIERAVLDAKKK